MLTVAKREHSGRYRIEPQSCPWKERPQAAFP